MTVTIVGSQLGDEGKGRVVDLLGEPADVVVRYQGGDNAGHTVVDGDTKYKLSLVPSGAIRGKVGLLGNGVVINPRTFFDEVDGLREQGLDPTVKMAKRAHVIMPYHRAIDGIEEAAKADSDLEAGTTGRGIGPTYEDKAGRRGIRIGDLLDSTVLRERLEYVMPHKRALYEEVYGGDPGAAFDIEALFEEFSEFGERIRSEGLAVDVGTYLEDRIAAGDRVMLEGAQGTSLDIDHGIYPYVTSSNPTAGYASTGSGLGVTEVGQGSVIGVIKAYLSRVGTGPLPTELDGDLAEYIREEGGEYGTVTGRPRRVGHLDMPMLRTATRANGFTDIAINHLDVLAGLDEVKVGHAYEHDGETRDTMPATTERWGECEPVYRTFEGWSDVDWEAVAATGFKALPEPAKEYVSYIEAELGVPAVALGLGPARETAIVREDPWA
ncbi:adenylosuccinate synthase [Halodesulfurarchaeum sp.]|uniref:adenylosuccinate synthase n=1 Tax=Halodesulfurarchaeum sp. TaxID=1980530 RepID=UPI001BBCA6B0|nr:adenylosuccinate synthase [Halodesulfurarchaeum sp.]